MVRSLRERRGKYGLAKYRAFSVLANRDWVTSRELLLLSGLKYHTITRLLQRWILYGYVERRLSLRYGVGSYEYRLLSRGLGWLQAASKDLPNAKAFARDLVQWQRAIKPRVAELMQGTFQDVLEAVDTAPEHEYR